MEAFLADHRDFTERVLERGRGALGGVSVSDWLESEVEVIARFGRRRSHIELNPRLRSELHVTHIERPEYRELPARGKARGEWSGSIGVSERGHRVAVIRANGLAQIRSLEAHEFGHAIVQRHSRFWHAVGRGSQLVDRSIERLVDDAARLLLLPPSLLGDLLKVSAAEASGEAERSRLWGMLPSIARAAILPPRWVATRMASILIEREAILFCYTIPRQRSLFGETEFRRDSSGRVRISIPWMMAYRRHPDPAQRYVFADRVGEPRKVVMAGELLSQAGGGPEDELSETLVRKLAGNRGWPLVKGAKRIQRIGSAMLDDKEAHFVLCA